MTAATTDIDRLIMACAAGDRGALKALYDVEAARMTGVAVRLLKRRSLAEEAVHDAFLHIWKGAATFDPARGAGKGWIYAVLRHRALAILRDEARLETREAPLDEEIASEEDDPETVIARLMDSERLRHCLEGLEPKRRQSVVLAFVNGLSHGELAGRLGVPLGTVKSWIRRSLERLKECLA
jgi:RNA polymerase sigma-70 factor (ECF subfamily)